MANSIRRLENNNAEGVAHLLPAYTWTRISVPCWSGCARTVGQRMWS